MAVGSPPGPYIQPLSKVRERAIGHRAPLHRSIPVPCLCSAVVVNSITEQPPPGNDPKTRFRRSRSSSPGVAQAPKQPPVGVKGANGVGGVRLLWPGGGRDMSWAAMCERSYGPVQGGAPCAPRARGAQPFRTPRPEAPLMDQSINAWQMGVDMPNVIAATQDDSYPLQKFEITSAFASACGVFERAPFNNSAPLGGVGVAGPPPQKRLGQYFLWAFGKSKISVASSALISLDPKFFQRLCRLYKLSKTGGSPLFLHLFEKEPRLVVLGLVPVRSAS